MLNFLRRKKQQVSTDGIYDAKACYPVLKNKEIMSCIPAIRIRWAVLGRRRS
ncbi:hypothetical protein [Candidatus Enterovibrio escicola]|uniref:hypothetical protein n=1 Tax=Candidatus Enterovibrio escicola TaxID=1927127 RepID=UPI001680E66D|nr:hypothetical protein [Candidatus Enterovibrio escacola]